MNAGRTLFFEPGAEIDVHGLERVLQAVVFYADVVYLRASAPINALNDNLIRNVLAGLEELGLVNWWAHEYEVSKRSVVSERYGGATRRADLVVPASAFAGAVGKVDDVIATSRAAAYDFVPQAEGDLRQGIAEVVDFRQKLIALHLNEVVGTDGVLTTPTWVRSFEQSATALTDDERRDQLMARLVSAFDIGRLSALKQDELVRLRAKTARFAGLIEERLQVGEQKAGLAPTPEALAAMIRTEYEEFVADTHPSSALRTLGKETTWSIVGLQFPASFMVRCGVDLFGWARRRRAFALVSDLRRVRLPKE